MKTKTWMRPLALSAVLATGAAACEDSGTNAPAFDDEALKADVALVAADGMFEDLAFMESTTFWAGTGFAPEAAGIEFESSRTFKRTVTFFDGDNNEQGHFDPLSTAKIHVVSELEREASHTFWSAKIKRDRDMWVTGLEGEETTRTWNGTGNSNVEKSRHPEDGAQREYDMVGTSVIENVVRGVPRADNPYPLSGTITRTMNVTLTVDGVTETKVIVVEITFNGTQFADMDVNGDTFQVDLAQRGVKGRFNRNNG